MYIDSIKFSLRVKNNVNESAFFLPVGNEGLCKYTRAQTARIYTGGRKHFPVIGQMLLHCVPPGYRHSSQCVEPEGEGGTYWEHGGEALEAPFHRWAGSPPRVLNVDWGPHVGWGRLVLPLKVIHRRSCFNQLFRNWKTSLLCVWAGYFVNALLTFSFILSISQFYTKWGTC